LLIQIKSAQTRKLGSVRRTCHAQFKCPLKAGIGRWRIGCAIAQRPSTVEKDRIVPKRQRLERSIRALPSRAGCVGIRRVKGHQHRVRHRALEKDIHSTAITIFPFALFPFDGIGVAERRNVRGQCRPNARSTNLLAQKSARGQVHIPHDFGFKAQPVLSREQCVERINVH